MKKFVSNIFHFALLWLIVAAKARACTILQNAKIIIPTTNNSIHEQTNDVLIDNGRIQEIGGSIARDCQKVDLHGQYLLPGLIDAHVHLQSVPGSLSRNDSEKTYIELFFKHLKSYLAVGVTTVLDAATSEDSMNRLNNYFHDGGVGPNVYYLAPFLTPKDGYFATPSLVGKSFNRPWQPVSDRRSLADSLDRAAIYHPLGVKVTIEHGFGPFEVWPIFDGQMRSAIRAETMDRGLPVFAHATTQEEHLLALDLAPRGIMHAGFYDEFPGPLTLSRLKESGVSIVSTLSIHDSTLMKWRRSRIEDIRFTRFVPPLELETAKQTKPWDDLFDKMLEVSIPWYLPTFVAKIFQSKFVSATVIEDKIRSSQRAIKAMHDFGIPIVLGTDSGCWPFFPQIFHGPTSIREIQLLVDAGLSPTEAIKSATINAAKMLGIDHDFGSVEIGKVADLVVVSGDPRINIDALQDISFVVKKGVVKTPAEWFK